MPGKMARSDPRPSVRVTRGAGDGQHLASVLQEGRENANIDAGSGFIWRISINGVMEAADERGRLQRQHAKISQDARGERPARDRKGGTAGSGGWQAEG